VNRRKFIQGILLGLTAPTASALATAVPEETKDPWTKFTETAPHVLLPTLTRGDLIRLKDGSVGVIEYKPYLPHGPNPSYSITWKNNEGRHKVAWWSHADRDHVGDGTFDPDTGEMTNTGKYKWDCDLFDAYIRKDRFAEI
jgi:hypothetical protein